MNYPVRCSMILSMLKNCKRYENAHFYKVENDFFLDVKTRREADLIAKLNGLMTDAWNVYELILNYK